jgi:hypothetical protein
MMPVHERPKHRTIERIVASPFHLGGLWLAIAGGNSGGLKTV